MRIALAIALRGKNVAFVTDTLKKLSLKKAIVYTEKGRLELVHIARTKLGGKYLRSNPNGSADDNLDAFSVSLPKLHRAKDDIGIVFGEEEFRLFRKLHRAYIRSLQERGDVIMTVDGHLWTPRKWVVDEVSRHVDIVRKAAREFQIDPNLLGAIIIDEYVRYNIFDVLGDAPGAFIGGDTSVGIAQVTLRTAKDVIRNGYYNPNPDDPKLSPVAIRRTPDAYLYRYVREPKHNIYLAAGRIRQMIDHWSPVKDLRRSPDIIATLYSKGLGEPKGNPQSSDRGTQIVDEFYPLFLDILKQ